MKSIDLGNSPDWFKKLWTDSDSKYLKIINMNDPPPWLKELRETNGNLLPCHLQSPTASPSEGVPTPPPPPKRDRHGNGISTGPLSSVPLKSPQDEPLDRQLCHDIDFNNPPMWFKILWHQPNSDIRKVLVEYLDPDNPPIWLQRAWNEFAHSLPAHLSKPSFMPTSAPSARSEVVAGSPASFQDVAGAPVVSPAPSVPQQGAVSGDTPDGFPDNCSNFTFDYVLYDRKNAPATSFIWDGFDVLKSSLPANINAAHARVANFITTSREKINGMDALIKEFQSIRTRLNRNIGLAVQRQKAVEASPAWLNRFTPAAPEVKVEPHSGLGTVIKCLDSLTPSQVETLQFLSGDALAHLRSSLVCMSGEPSSTISSHAAQAAIAYNDSSSQEGQGSI